jgi:hypothetical protein
LKENGDIGEYKLFIDAIMNGTIPPVTAEDGYLIDRFVKFKIALYY